MRSTMMRAPVHVLPVPGGPCTNSAPPSSAAASARGSLRRAERREAADRLRVVHQLVERHLLAALEEPPPRGPRLAPVIFEQLAREPARGAHDLAGDERLAERLALEDLRALHVVR